VPSAPFSFVRSGPNPGSQAGAADSSGVATHCWTSAGKGFDVVTATSGTELDRARVEWLPRAVDLSAQAYIEILPLQALVTVRPRATLRDTAGAPIAGRVIRFMASTVELCRATTGDDGNATCKTTLRDNLQAVLAMPYEARFDGDAIYREASAAGTLICIGRQCPL